MMQFFNGLYKKFGFLLLVVALSVPGILPLVESGTVDGQDTAGHGVRLAQFSQAIQDGHVPVRWAPSLYSGLGYPVFNFSYAGLYYASMPLLWLGFTPESSLELMLATGYLMAGLLFYTWFSHHVPRAVALVGTILFQYAPYRFTDMYERGAITESLAFIFIPLVLLIVDRLRARKRVYWAGFVIAGLILTHNISAVMLSGVYFMYLILRQPIRQRLHYYLKGCGLFASGVLLSSFFWVPALYELRFVAVQDAFVGVYTSHFLSLSRLLLPFQVGYPDNLSLYPGLLHVSLSVFLVFFLLKRLKKLEPYLILVITLSIVSVFLMLPVSRGVWEVIPGMSVVQFPWRFQLLLSFSLSVMGALGYATLNRQVHWRHQTALLVLVVSLSLALSLKQWHGQPKVYATHIPRIITHTTLWKDEYTPKWMDSKLLTRNGFDVESKILVPQNGQKYILSWKTHQHEYLITVEQETHLVERTMYYPGWTAVVNGQEREIDYYHPEYPGLISFRLPPGTHQVKTSFEETPLRAAANNVSSVSLLGSGIYLLGGFIYPKLTSRSLRPSPRV